MDQRGKKYDLISSLWIFAKCKHIILQRLRLRDSQEHRRAAHKTLDPDKEQKKKFAKGTKSERNEL